MLEMRFAGIALSEQMEMPPRAIEMKGRRQLAPILADMRRKAALHHVRDHSQGKRKISKHV